MKEFFNTQMFKNLVLVITLDLENPAKLEENFRQWHFFIKESIYTILEDFDISLRKKILQSFECTRQKLKDLFTKPFIEDVLPSSSSSEDEENDKL